MADVLILSRAEMESLLTLEAIVPVIEKAFIAFTEQRTVAYPVALSGDPPYLDVQLGSDSL